MQRVLLFGLSLRLLAAVEVFEPPHEHPRLYLMARDIPDLRRRMAHPVTKPAWDEFGALAKQNEQARLESEALQFLLNHDVDRARRTVAAALRFLQQHNPDLKIPNISRNTGRILDTGAIVYDWCYPVLTVEQKAAFIVEFVRLAKTLECGYPPKKSGLVIGHPSEWMILRDMLSAGIATYDENPEMYRAAAGRFFNYQVPARNWWYPSHAFNQGPGYADARFVSDLYAQWIFHRMGAGNVFDPSHQFVPYQWIYLRRPDGKFIRSGDGQNWPTRLGSLFTSSYYGDGYTLSNFLQYPTPRPSTPLMTYDSRLDDLFEFLWRDTDLKPLPISDLPLSRYFGFPQGWMVARTGWGPDSAIAEMRTNIYNIAGHQHADGGSFEIYYKGPLAIHSGVYQGITGGYGSPHHVNYYQRTIAHNTLLIHDPQEKFSTARFKELSNDGGQRITNWPTPATLDDLLNNPVYKTGAVLSHGFGPNPRNPDYTYLKGDITAAYSDKVREVKRSFVFLNLGAGAVPAALIVFDRVVAANPAFAKYWLLQSVTEPAVDGARSVVALAKHGWSGKLVNTTLLPEPGNASISTVGGPGKEFSVFGQNFPNATVPPDPEAGGWRVEVSPKQLSATDLFLNVMQVMDRSAKAPPVEKIESGSTVGVRLSDRVVLFDSSGGRVRGPISFQVRGAGTLRFLVTDLAEGNWQVWRDGRIANPSLIASDDSGTLYFNGPAGVYSLRR